MNSALALSCLHTAGIPHGAVPSRVCLDHPWLVWRGLVEGGGSGGDRRRELSQLYPAAGGVCPEQKSGCDDGGREK